MRGSHSGTLGIVGLVLLLSGGLSWAGGTGNTAYGSGALPHDNGNYNSAFGGSTLYQNYSGSNNTASGYSALYYNSIGNYNTASGAWALSESSTGNYNTASGAYALAINDDGSKNTANGAYALSKNITGAENTASGYYALYNNNAGHNNTALGYEAGQANTTGTNNTFVGYLANAREGTYANGTALGHGATLTASNSIVLGNNAITKIYAKVTTITAISDRRRKKGIVALPSDLGLDFIAKLKPVSYKFNDGDETERFGFIAQDIEQALPASFYDTIERSEPEHGLALIERQNDADRTYRVAYGELLAPMVKAIQEQQQEIATARQENAHLRNALEAQAAEIEALRHSMEALRQRVAAAQ